MMTLMKSIFKINILLVSIALLAGCSEWTTPESIEIEKNSIEQTNPELYAKYCDALKEYKASEHKIAYTTFLNSPEIAANGSEKISMIPDSVDFVQLMNLEVSETHLNEMKQVKEKFGTRFVVRFSLTECQAAYEAYVEEMEAAAEETEGEGTQTEPEIMTFEAFYAEQFQKVTAKVAEYGLDGFTFEFTGKNYDGMTSAQKEEYAAASELVMAPLKTWLAANTNKVFFLEGNPQYVLDSEILAAASYFILPTRDCRSAGELGHIGLNAFTSGKLPENAKLLYSVETPSFIEEEYLVGKFIVAGQYEDQIPLAADWIAKDASFEKSGLVIWNLQRDYFNPGFSYPNVRQAIKTMNPNE
jgi:hypothetical protein